METKQEHFLYKSNTRKGERGNVLIYVLIAIALFAALSFTLGRQTDTSEAGTLDEERANLYATQLITYASQVKSVYDQMEMNGALPDSAIPGDRYSDFIDFVLPNDTSGFNDPNTANNIYKIYHPEGGGLTRASLPANMIDDSNIGAGLPPADWYLGRFNDMDWSTPDPDILLVAYGIAEAVCASINEKINGMPDIPVMTEPAHEVFVDENITFNGAATAQWTAGSQVPSITTTGGTPICAECNNMASLCVQGSGGVYAYYSVTAER